MTEYEQAVQKVRAIEAKGKGEMGFPLEEDLRRGDDSLPGNSGISQQDLTTFRHTIEQARKKRNLSRIAGTK